MILDFMNGVEQGIAAAKQRYKERKGFSPDKPAYNPDNIKWERAQGASGPYERSEDANSADFKLLLKDLAQHNGKLSKDGYFYWLFQNGTIIGRKKRGHGAP
jgi:hypothetical protein